MMNALILLLFAAPLAAADTPIEEVVLLPDRAEVIRGGKSSCTQGTAEVVFSPLPTTLDPRTLRAEASGGTEVLGIRHETVQTTEAVSVDVATLKKAQREVDDRIAALEDERKRLQGERARMDRYATLYRDASGEQLRSARPNRRAWTVALNGFAAERLRVAAGFRELDAKVRDLRIERDRIVRQLNRLSGRPKAYVRATVTAACRRASAGVRLAYVVPQARWHPEYDLDFRPGRRGKGRAVLTMSAIVEQSTGEDWKNVRLRLSTARPTLGVEAPYPRRMLIDGKEKKTKKVLVQGYEKRDVLTGGAQGQDRGPTGAQLDDGGNTIALALPRRVTVLADGRRHWFPVDRAEASAKEAFVALPRLKRSVFRVARFQNPAGYALLAGTINSFVDGAFVGRSPLTFKGANEPMEVSLGLEPGLALDRKQRTDKDAVKGFLSKTKHQARAYRSSLDNRTKRKLSVEIREQIPVAQNEAIEVRLIKDGTTRGYQVDQDRGLVSWTVDVAPGRRTDVDIAFEIEFPDDWKTN